MKKLGEYALAVVIVLGILGLLYLIVNGFLQSEPEVGTITYKCGDEQITPIQNEIYITENRVSVNKKRLVLEEFSDIPSLNYNGVLNASIEGKSENGAFYFTIYNEDYSIYAPQKASFTDPKEKGIYIVHVETYWGTEKDNIGMEYYFKLVRAE